MTRKIFTITAVLLAAVTAAGAADNFPEMDWVKEVGARDIQIPAAVFYAEDFGAVGDGTTMNTAAIQAALDACRDAGGGVVTFRGGRFVTGSVYIHDGIYFNIPQGTTLLGSEDLADYPDIDTRVAGVEMVWPSALVNVLDGRNVRIGGGGDIDGRGKVFWDSYWSMRRDDYEPRGLRWIVDYDCKRARMILIQDSENVVLDNLTLKRAGFWTVQLVYSKNCTVDGIVIRNNIGGHGPSTDGIDIDSSSYILVQNCDIDCNDDDYCLKAGRDADGLRVARPCEYIVLRNCISRRGGGLLTCGSETSGGIRYVLAEDLHAIGSSSGIRLKSAFNRGGYIEHIYMRRVVMEDVRGVLNVTLNWNPTYSYSELPAEYEGQELPPHWYKMLERVEPERGIARFSDIHMADIDVKSAGVFVQAEGVEQSLLRNITFTDIVADVDFTGGVEWAEDWVFDNVSVNSMNPAPFTQENSANIIWKDGAGRITYNHTLPGRTAGAATLASDWPEMAFLVPELAGGLKFGIARGGTSKWLADADRITVEADEKGIVWHVTDELLGNATIEFATANLTDSDGMIMRVSGDGVPDGTQLVWAFGGAAGVPVEPDRIGSIEPRHCVGNLHNIERSNVGLGYGEAMNFRRLTLIAPVDSEIVQADARRQWTPLDMFASGKRTEAHAVAGLVPLDGEEKYFCVSRRSRGAGMTAADYNIYTLPEIFSTYRNLPRTE
ncbi:MAG: DUF4450 domain-containing protein [Alistipes sp.]|nr:DUF4450 domain-containing protein [Alistipes sp.]